MFEKFCLWLAVTIIVVGMPIVIFAIVMIYALIFDIFGFV